MPEIIELPILQCVFRLSRPPTARVLSPSPLITSTRATCLGSFNDVYRVNQRYVPEDGVENREGGPRYISAAQFARQLDDVRDGWADSPIGQNEKEGLVLFSGGRSNTASFCVGHELTRTTLTCQTSSRQVSNRRQLNRACRPATCCADGAHALTFARITRGSHMVPLLNRFHLAASCLGNHDVDYGWPHLSKLVADLNFPCASAVGHSRARLLTQLTQSHPCRAAL